MPTPRGQSTWNKGLRKVPAADRKTSLTILVPANMIPRLNALSGGVAGQRSALCEELLMLGLMTKYGPGWEQLADSYVREFGPDGWIKNHPENVKRIPYSRGRKEAEKELAADRRRARLRAERNERKIKAEARKLAAQLIADAEGTGNHHGQDADSQG